MHALGLRPTVAPRRNLVDHGVALSELGGARVPVSLQVEPYVVAPVVGTDEAESTLREHALYHAGLLPPRHLSKTAKLSSRGVLAVLGSERTNKKRAMRMAQMFVRGEAALLSL